MSKFIQNSVHGERQSITPTIDFIATTPVAKGNNEGRFRVHISNMPQTNADRSPASVITLSLGQLQNLADAHTSGSVPALIALVNASGGTTTLRMDTIACHAGESYERFDGTGIGTYETTHWRTESYTLELDDTIQSELTTAGINNAIAISQSSFNNSMNEALTIGEKMAKRKKERLAKETAERVAANANLNSEPEDTPDDTSDDTPDDSES